MHFFKYLENVFSYLLYFNDETLENVYKVDCDFFASLDV